MNPLIQLLIIVFVAIAIIVLATNKLKAHPFLALVVSALFVGFATGINPQQIIELITSGFGGILSGIGIIVVLGTVMGVFVEKSGALSVIADNIIRLFGSRYLVAAISLLGATVSIPVFCDSGFIILSRLVQKLARLKRTNSIPLSLSLGAGLYTTHTLIPPTPGPIAVAGNLEVSSQLGVVILTGILVAIPVLVVSTLYAIKLSRTLHFDESEADRLVDSSEQVGSSKLSLWWAMTPILTPILLISLASVIQLAGLQSWLSEIMLFLGNPTIALLLGCILSIVQVNPSSSLNETSDLFKKGIAQSGPIILITGAGGAFGSVLKGTDLGTLLADQLGDSIASFPILVITSFVIAALLKTAQGSSTSALVIASAMMAPLLTGVVSITLFQTALLVMAFGGGAMTVSHANDSYFWVITQFSGMTVKQGYRWFSLLTLFQGLTVLATVLSLYYLSLIF